MCCGNVVGVGGWVVSFGGLSFLIEGMNGIGVWEVEWYTRIAIARYLECLDAFSVPRAAETIPPCSPY